MTPNHDPKSQAMNPHPPSNNTNYRPDPQLPPQLPKSPNQPDPKSTLEITFRLYADKFYGCVIIKSENGKATHIETNSTQKWQYKDLPEV